MELSSSQSRIWQPSELSTGSQRLEAPNAAGPVSGWPRRLGGRPAGDRQGCIRIWITEVIQVLRRHSVAHQGGIWGPGSPPVSAPPYQVCAGGAAEQDVCRTLTIIRSTAWLCDFTQPSLITCYCLQKARIFFSFFALSLLPGTASC